MKEIIVKKALEMYNKYGVEFVGVRELAKELNVKGGNITYYFPTKNDLLRELANRLTTSNSEILSETRKPGLLSFMQMNMRMYANQYKYRAFFISLPLWLKQDLEFAHTYREGQVERRKSFSKELKTLLKDGYLLSRPEEEMKTLFDAMAATSRLWICEAALDGLIENENLAVKTYLKRMAGLLSLTASKKGKAELEKFLKELV